MAGAGALLAIGGASESGDTTVILAGVVVLELGLIICTPALLGLTARLGRQLPLAARIALRDAGRNRSSAAPAVAAVMAAVIGAVAILIGVASASALNRRTYQPQLLNHDAYVTLDSTQGRRAAEISAALGSAMPVAKVSILRAPNDSCVVGDTRCTTSQITIVMTPEQQRRTFAQSRYRGGLAPPAIFDNGDSVDALFGTPVPAAAAALRAGHAVVVDRSLVHDGMVTVAATTLTATAGAEGASGATPQAEPHTLTLPAVVIEQGFPMVQLILPPGLAPLLGVTLHPAGVFVDNTRAPTDQEMQAADGALNRIDDSVRLYVESGYHDSNGWMPLGLIAAAAAIAIAAAVIATALANLDSRAAMITLASVGAGPHTMRVLSMARAGVIAGIGTAIGVIAGIVPPAAWVQASRSVTSASSVPGETEPARLTLTVPWLPIAVALVGIPLAAAVIAGLFTRSRLPSDRAAE